MASRVFSPSELPFGAITGVAIAITAVDATQRHVGLLHQDRSTGQVMLLHLAWHCDLRNDAPELCYAWVEPPIHLARARQVAARCRQILRANPSGLPFAFSPPNDCFDEETGAFLFGPTRHGLTCASFVLAVFHSAGLPLVAYETWPRRHPGDEQWQRQIVESLRHHSKATEAHLRAVESELGLIRFRPEEVAGAGLCDSVPADFSEVMPNAHRVLEKLDAMAAA